jgi:hypothetical protein
MPETEEAVTSALVTRRAATLPELRRIIAVEQARIDTELRSGPRYLSRVADRRIPIVHAATCISMRHHVDLLWSLEEKARGYGTDEMDIFRHGYGPGHTLPLLSRADVEALPRYRTCHMCAPTLDHAIKVDQAVEQEMQNVKARRQSWSQRMCRYLGAADIGRYVQNEDGESLGILLDIEVRHSLNGSSVTLTFHTTAFVVRDLDDRLWFSKQREPSLSVTATASEDGDTYTSVTSEEIS